MEYETEEDYGLKVDEDEAPEDLKEAMQEMECWQVDMHLRSCPNHKTS